MRREGRRPFPLEVMKGAGSHRSLYLSAWSIVGAVLILLAVIAFSTYSKVSRETDRMEEGLLREGQVIIRAIEAALRAESPASDPNRLARLLEEVARSPEIASAVVFDAGGTVAAAAGRYGPPPDKMSGAASLARLLAEKGMVTRYGELPRAGRTFEVIRPFRPIAGPLERGFAAGRPPGQMIALALRTETFEEARKEDHRHTVLMAAILIVLGSGALFFLFVVQSYTLADKSLSRMRIYLHNVVESMADGLVSLDKEGRIVTSNRQAAELLGVERARLPGRDLASFFGGPEALSFVLGGETVRDRQMEITVHGQEIPVGVTSAPLRDEAGSDEGAVLILRDLRPLRELQERLRREERLAALGRLAAGVAHEVRNPLSSIKGFAQYFLGRFRGREEEGYAQVMVREVDRLNRVVADLLDFARPKEPHRLRQDLPDLVEHALTLLTPDLKAKGVRLVKVYGDDLPALFVDQDHMVQALLNLLINALDAVPQGGTITLELRRAAGGGVETVISDSGEGIAPEDLPKVFDPFFSRKRTGSGLGLAIVHQIVAAHGGRIEAASLPGTGAAFRIFLPA